MRPQLTGSLNPKMLMIRVNVPLQISNSTFVYGEIIKMHIMHECNYMIIKLPRNGNSKAKKLTKTIQFVEVIRHS